MYEETGLSKLEGITPVGFYEEDFPNGEFGPIHTVSVVYEAEVEGEVKIDKQSSAFKWADRLPENFVNNIQ